MDLCIVHFIFGDLEKGHLFPKKYWGGSIATTLVVWRVPQSNRKSLVCVSRVVGTGVENDVFEI